MNVSDTEEPPNQKNSNILQEGVKIIVKSIISDKKDTCKSITWVRSN